MKIFLLTVLSFQLCLATAARRDCNEIKLKADQCVRHAILIGREEFEIPRTVPELDKMVCSSVNADLRCVGSIKQCLKPFQRTIVNLALKSVRKTIEESVCGNEQSKEQFVDILKCIKSKSELQSTAIILDKVSAILVHVHDNIADTEILPSLCCVYALAVHNTEKIVDKLCGQQYGARASNFVVNIVSNLFGEAVEFTCGKYATTSHCQSKLPRTFSAIHSTWNSTWTRYKTSPVIPLLNILDRLDQQQNLQ